MNDGDFLFVSTRAIDNRFKRRNCVMGSRRVESSESRRVRTRNRGKHEMEEELISVCAWLTMSDWLSTGDIWYLLEHQRRKNGWAIHATRSMIHATPGQRACCARWEWETRGKQHVRARAAYSSHNMDNNPSLISRCYLRSIRNCLLVSTDRRNGRHKPDWWKLY